VPSPAAFEVRNPGLSVNGDGQKTCKRSGLDHGGSREIRSEVSDRDQTFFQLNILFTK
jgi:hypothetical protein